jgi:hypothetical protein
MGSAEQRQFGIEFTQEAAGSAAVNTDGGRPCESRSPTLRHSGQLDQLLHAAKGGEGVEHARRAALRKSEQAAAAPETMRW